MLRKEQNLLEVWADHRNKEVRFGSDAGLSLEPLNRGLGRFLLAQAIAWRNDAGPTTRWKAAHWR